MKLAALLLAIFASCAMLKGIYGVAERAAPAATGAGAGALFGGPIGAAFGAAVGSAIAQAASGNIRTESQAEAVEDAIRGGSVTLTPGMVFAQYFWWIIGICVLLWFLRTPTNLVKDGKRWLIKLGAIGKTTAKNEKGGAARRD